MLRRAHSWRLGKSETEVIEFFSATTASCTLLSLVKSSRRRLRTKPGRLPASSTPGLSSLPNRRGRKSIGKRTAVSHWFLPRRQFSALPTSINTGLTLECVIDLQEGPATATRPARPRSHPRGPTRRQHQDQQQKIIPNLSGLYLGSVRFRLCMCGYGPSCQVPRRLPR